MEYKKPVYSIFECSDWHCVYSPKAVEVKIESSKVEQLKKDGKLICPICNASLIILEEGKF